MRTCRPLLLALMLLAPVAAAAQPPATLEGTAVDSSGAALVHARVTLSATGAAPRVLLTDTLGRFSATLAPGTYVVSVEAPGLTPAADSVTIAAGERRRFDVTLSVAAIHDVVVVSAQRLGSVSPLEPKLPGSFDTVPAALLEQTHPPSVNEALRHIGGVAVRDEEGNGLRPNIGIRGLNPTRSTKLLLLEDGVPVTFAPYGDNSSYYHPPIERFESIEVLKGSGQIAYGPSTVGGVINYLTPTPPQRLSGIFTATAGNRAYGNAGGTLGGSAGRVGLLVDVMRKQSDGARENMHSDLGDVSAKAMWTLSPNHVLIAKGSYYGEHSQITYSGLRAVEYAENPRQNPFVNDNFEGDRTGASLVHNAVLTSRTMVTTTAYAARFARDWWRQSSNSGQRPNDASDPLCGGMANLLTTCGNEGRLRRYTTAGIESRANVTHARGTLTAGARLHVETQNRRQENGDTPTARSGRLVEDNERLTDAFSGFVQHRFVAGRLAVTPGVRLEHVKNERTNRLANAGATGRATVTQVIPGVGAAYSVNASTLLFGGFHRGFAPPRVEDIITNSGGTVDLASELSWNAELGVRARPARGVNLEATLFRMDYENQIVPASLAGGIGSTLTNGGETLSQGFELGAGVEPHASWSRGLFGRVAYTWLPVARFEGTRFSSTPGFTATSVAGNRLPYAPEQLFTMTLGYAPLRTMDVFVEAVRVGEQFTDDLNTVPVSADGQRGLIEAALTWNAGVNLRPNGGRLQFFAVAYNLADRTYVADRSRGTVPAPPRRVQVGARVRF
ncbi:MAG TPA: TonB-dependent receptor [Vicinamibacterales bacterium]|nr:TonB-dependent receptor [Vicinamibacterales bacterium]